LMARASLFFNGHQVQSLAHTRVPTWVQVLSRGPFLDKLLAFRFSPSPIG
jgi:hypothetical protein